MILILLSSPFQFYQTNWPLPLPGYQAGGPKCQRKAASSLEIVHARHCGRTHKYRTSRDHSFRARLLQNLLAVTHRSIKGTVIQHVREQCKGKVQVSLLPIPTTSTLERFSLPCWYMSYHCLFPENQLRSHKLQSTRKVSAQAINIGISELEWKSLEQILSSTPTSSC